MQKNIKSKIKKIRKSKEDYKEYNRQLQKKKEYELNKRRKLIRRQNESNREKKTK